MCVCVVVLIIGAFRYHYLQHFFTFFFFLFANYANRVSFLPDFRDHGEPLPRFSLTEHSGRLGRCVGVGVGVGVGVVSGENPVRRK